MNNSQIKALADAESQSGIGQTGLVKMSGKKWMIDGICHCSSHHNNTIRSLVERGYLQLYVNGTVAHITDSGSRVLSEFRANG